MYSNVKSVQLLVAMLKEKGIDNIVMSAGTSHNAIVRSIEEDSFFKTFSIVDERSAAFFALGLIQQLKRPVAVMCTSGTAASNYLSGVTEAYYRKLPLIVITADKNPIYINQLEDLAMPQYNLYNDVIKYKVSLPLISNNKDYWYCERLLNEAFLELDHHGKGPIQINIPIEEGKLAIGSSFTSTELPKIKVIERVSSTDGKEVWEEKSLKLENCKRILLIYGQNNPISECEKKKIIEFASKYNCVIASEKISNFHSEYCVETGGITKVMSPEQLTNLMPEIVININGNYVSDIKYKLKTRSKEFESWLVSEEGIVQDQFRNLKNIFECTVEEFFDNITTNKNIKNNKEYLNIWKKAVSDYKILPVPYSNLYAVQELFKVIPNNSILNLSNSTTPRIASLFEINSEVEVYCNRGINGIDGSMSTFIGQSAATDKLSFLVIGDLSFFYDMNALWNRYLGKNIRIMLINNAGATLFHFNQGLEQLPTLNNAIAAEHFTTAKGWTESQGFKYISSKNEKEFNENLKCFVEESDKPIIFEVFTDKVADAELLHKIYDLNLTSKEKIKRKLKKFIRRG